MLNIEQGQALLHLARNAINEHFTLSPHPVPHEAWMEEYGATFVTLMQQGNLRGCIGSLAAYRSLKEDVRLNAIAAAFRDPRFAPLTADELHDTKVEVSLLSPARQLIFTSEQDALSQLKPGVDGITLEHGWHKGTFLPQVWEQLPEPKQFLEYLKIKAGLPAGFWSDDIQLSSYTVQKWHEAE